MSSSLDLSLYTSLTKDSFKVVEPTLVIAKEPSFFYYNKDLKLLLCSSCRYFLFSLKERTIREHLRDYHNIYYSNNIKGSKDSPIIKALTKLDNIELKSIGRIGHNTYYFQDLDLYFNSYVCKACIFITINKIEFRRHVYKNHDSTLRGSTIDKDYLLVNIPIQYLYEPKKIGAFIPKLPNLAISNLPILSPNSKLNIDKDESPSKPKALISRYHKTRDQLVKANPFNDKNYEQYPFITHFRFNSYLKDKNISTLLLDLDITYINKPIIKTLEMAFNEFLFNRVPIIYANITFFIPGLPSNIRLLLRNSNSYSSILANRFNQEFRELSLKTSQDRYSKEYSHFLIYLINIYKRFNREDSLLNTEPVITSTVKSLLVKLLSFNYSQEVNFTAKELEEIDSIILDIFYEILAIPIIYSTLDINPLFKNPLLTYLITLIISPTSNTYNYKTSGFIANHANFLVYNSRLTTIAKLRKVETEYLDSDIPYKLEELYNSIYRESIDLKASKVYLEIYNIYKATKAYNSAKTSIKNPIIDISLTELLINNELIRIPDIGNQLFLDLVKKAEDLLFNYLLLYSKDIDNNYTPDLDLNSLIDDLSLKTPTKGILNNPSFSIYKDTILNLVYLRGSKFNSFFYPDNPLNPSELRFNLAKVKLYLKIRDIFIKYLALLTYLLSGSPIRGKETLIIRYINTLFPRNIYLDIPSKLILVNTAYDKTGKNLRLAKENIRFLPTSISRLYLYYLTLVIPFYSYLKINYLLLKSESPYIFEINNKHLTTTTLSSLLRREAKNSLKVKNLTLSPWRDLILYIIKTRIQIDKDSLKATPFITRGYNANYVTPIQDLLANHSRFTAENHYGRDNTLFSNTNSSIYNRSKEFASLYFQYFNLIEIRPISTIIQDKESIKSLLSIKDIKLTKSPIQKEKAKLPKYLNSSSSSLEYNPRVSYPKATKEALRISLRKENLSDKSLTSIEDSDSSIERILLDNRERAITKYGLHEYKVLRAKAKALKLKYLKRTKSLREPKEKNKEKEESIEEEEENLEEEETIEKEEEEEEIIPISSKNNPRLTTKDLETFNRFRYSKDSNSTLERFKSLEEGSLEEGSLEEGSLEESSLEEDSLEEGSLEEGSLEESSLEEDSLEEENLEEEEIIEKEIEEEEVESPSSIELARSSLLSPLSIRSRNINILRERSISRKRERAITLTESSRVIKRSKEISIEIPKVSLRLNDYKLFRDTREDKRKGKEREE
jgi:hypothetical protein